MLLAASCFAEDKVYTDTDLEKYGGDISKNPREMSGSKIFEDTGRYPAESVTPDESEKYQKIVSQYLSDALKDPWSLKVAEVKGLRKGPYIIIDVKYRSKNSYGGYTKEEKWFIFKDSQLVYIYDP
jgi:hypothetical protein